MKRFSFACLLPLAVIAGIAPTSRFALAEASSPVAMASHHATYKLTLLKAKGTNAPASASGLIDYSFAGSDCDGYTTVFRQMTEMQPSDGDSKLNDMRSTTFEDGAGTQFTFKTKTTTDDDTVADLDGRAQKAADGSVSVDLKHPAGKANFGQDVLFPTEHLRRVIASAEKGDKLLSAKVYDGSETGRKIYQTAERHRCAGRYGGRRRRGAERCNQSHAKVAGGDQLFPGRQRGPARLRPLVRPL